MLSRERIGETGFSLSDEVPAAPERRRQERQLTILRVGLLLVDGRRELCLIRNISAGGLMAHVYTSLTPGQEVTVELKSNQQIGGRIVWARDGNAGIGFEAPIEVAELLAHPPVADKGWRPRLPRVEIDRLATLRAGSRTYWVQARDISQGGVKIETEQRFEAGAELVVTLEGFRPIPGTVRWQGERGCGIAFNQLIPFEELIGWLKR
ncbi:MAG TPA: PilZ domain-containing protein [Allosphingosinicella sp.]|nr:PilZ domain-containing protein [Allosphingosinicella sp.]